MPRRLPGIAAICLAASLTVLGQSKPAPARPASDALTQAELFQATKVWTAHLRFTPDQWQAITPTIARRTFGSGNSGEWLQGAPGERNGWGSAQGVEFDYVRADLEFAGRTFHDVAVRHKGNGTYMDARSSGKLSFKVDLNKYVKGQKLDGLSTLNFHNNITDPSWMNEVIAFRLYRDAGVPAPRSSYVKVFVTIGTKPPVYHGLYSIAENVDTNFFEARPGSSVGGILKPVSVRLFADLGDDWSRYVQTYDPKTDLSLGEQQRVIEFCRFVTRANDADFAARIGEFVDLEAFAKYLSALVWINNIDSMLDRGQNFYMHLGLKTRKFIFVPWDQDHSFGRFSMVQRGDYARGDINQPWVAEVKFLRRMLAVPAFRTAYIARMRETATLFVPERVRAQMDEIGRAIRPAVAEEPHRLAGFDREMSAQSTLVAFVAARARSVNEQLARQR